MSGKRWSFRYHLMDINGKPPMLLHRQRLPILIPHTFNSFQKLVMAMADVVKNADKKTLFGRDKGQIAYAKFLEALKATLHSMVLDGVISESTPSDIVVNNLDYKLRDFASAYPNWMDAYSFAAKFLDGDCRDAIATVERLRSMP